MSYEIPTDDPEFCECCHCQNVAYAERLMAVVEHLGVGDNRLVLCNDGLEVDDLAIVALAIKFHQRGKGMLLRALVEHWSQERLVREMY